VYEEAIQGLISKSVKRLAFNQSTIETYQTIPDCCVGPLAFIEIFGWVTKVNELWIINRHGQEVAFKRKELENWSSSESATRIEQRL
jgi:hypothetical protein